MHKHTFLLCFTNHYLVLFLESCLFLAHFDNRHWVMFPMAKTMFFFPVSRRKFPIPETKKKKSPLCDILTALCHNKLYFYIQNVEMFLFVNQIFDFLFNLIILYGVSFSQFCMKRCEKFPLLGSFHVPKMGRKNPGGGPYPRGVFKKVLVE